MKRKPVTKPVDLEKRARAMANQWTARHNGAYLSSLSICDCDECKRLRESLTKLLLRAIKIGKESR